MTNLSNSKLSRTSSSVQCMLALFVRGYPEPTFSLLSMSQSLNARLNAEIIEKRNFFTSTLTGCATNPSPLEVYLF